MNARQADRLRAVALVVVASVASVVALVARAATAPDPGGFVGKGQLVVQTAIGGASTKLTIGGDIALEQRGDALRLDILSLAVPGADAALSSVLATQLFPPGGFTIVYDRKASSYTIWSTAKRTYYASGPASGPQNGSTGVPASGGGTAAAIGAAGGLFDVFSLAKSLKNDSAFSATLSLAGHGVVNGHPATGLDYAYAATAKGGDRTDVHGRFQLADDLDALPVQITASAKGKAIPESALKLDLASLAKSTPNEADFVVPQGYGRAATIGDVIGKTLPL
ncbi:MAG: hypothetical protein NVSMB21_02440 [Vulcanimicrobiaceae bacterium]